MYSKNGAIGKMKVAPQNVYRGKPIRRMHVMVKPTGAHCNLDCTYCYYLSKQQLLGKPEDWRISDETLETFIRQYFEGQNHKEVVFSWQGGEPTLLGIDFFRRVVEFEKKYCPPMFAARTTFKPTERDSAMPGAGSCARKIFWLACPSTAPWRCMTATGRTNPARVVSSG